MLKIRRIHIVNSGYEEATFDGEIFDFRDPISGDPAHCVLHAENGTGKTTALGLIFNVLIPKEARFLPHLVKPDYQFADYFSHGVAVIAIEWHDPAGRHPVTVHFVVPQLRGSERQTWRRWVVFRNGPGFSFDDLPLKGVAGRLRTTFTGRDDVALWLREEEERFADSHDFEAASTQEAWHRMLERHGIDTHLMDSQLEFNRQEGGLDSFLKIPREEDFITRFLGLCLVAPDQADALPEPVCAQVRAIVARMQGYDKLIAKHGLLTDLGLSFRPFAEIALTWRNKQREIARVQTHAASVKQAAARRAEALEAQVGDAEVKAQNDERHKEELRTKAGQAERTAAAGRLALARARAKAADEERLAATARSNAAAQLCSRLAAARDLRDILALEAELVTYRQSVTEAEKEAEEPRGRAHAAGAMLAAAIGQAVAEHRRAAERERRAAEDAEAARLRARATLKHLADQTIQAQREDAELDAKIATADREFARLQAESILRPGESVVAAMARLAGERDEAAAAARDADGRANRHDVAEQAANKDVVKGEAARREALAQAEAERRLVKAADRARDDLLQGKDWQAHLGPSLLVDPQAAQAASSRARQRAEESRRAHARADLLRQDADRISRHRVAAVDRNVDLVLGRLTDAGVRSAMAAATWLAEVIGDVALLRAFATTDPAVFAGVFVQDPAELARVLSLDFSGLALDRPVAVLAPMEQPGQAQTLTVIPDRIEAYDITAAEALVEDLGAMVGDVEVEAETASADAEVLTGLKLAIEAWIAEWGGGRLEASRQRVNDREGAAKRAEASAAEARRRADAERLAATEARGQAQGHRDDSDAAERRRAEAQRWQKAYGDFLPEWRDRRARLAEHLSDLAGKETLERERLDTAQTEAEEARNRMREARRTIDGLGMEAERIEFSDAEPPAEPSPLADARARYQAAAEVWRRHLEDRLGPLQGKIEAKQQELEARNERLRRDHGEMADDHTALIEDARDPALERRLAAARTAERQEREAVGRAKGEAERLGAEAQRQERPFARFGEAGRLVLAELDGYTVDELEGIIVTADETVRTAGVEVERVEAAITAARADASRWTGEALRLRDRAQSLPTRPAPETALPESLTEALAEIDSARTGLEAAVDHGRRLGQTLADSYDAFRREARGHRDRVLEAVLIDTLVANEAEPAAEDAERLKHLLADRIATLQQEIDEYEADKNRAVGEMDGLLLSAVTLFLRAANRGIVPDHVPRFGGRRILTMAFRPPATEGEAAVALRRNLCQQALIDYVAAGEMPQTDHAMAAALLERYARSVQSKPPEEPALGLRLLKSNDQGRIHHLPVAAFKASGGETLTSAMLLYLLVARLRSEGRASQRARIGGVLILDNPLGKASNALFLRMQLALARAMDVQLIFTTAVKDWAAVGEFPQVVKLRKETTDPATGRIFVKATHQWLGEPEATAGVAAEVEVP